jgi:hypothetical protein
MQNSLTLPSVRKAQEKDRPRLTSFDCGHECSCEHFAEVFSLVEAEEDNPSGSLFLHRWLERCWPFEEEEFVIENSSVFEESSEHCLVA